MSLIKSISRRFSELGKRLGLLTRGQRAGLALGTLATLVVLAGATYVLTRNDAPDCTPNFCAEILGPSGEDVDPMTPVRIRLRGVDQAAAVDALSISNSPKGSATFNGDVLSFKPEWPGFARGARYEVTLALAKTAVAQSRRVDLKGAFRVGGRLEVAVVLPSDGTKEVAQDAEIYVQFNRSVASLSVLATAMPDGVLSFSPPVAGAGRWLNTSLYVFAPQPGWQPATAYAGRVKAGLTTQLGSQLDTDYEFSFQTVTPAVLSASPADNSRFVMPEPEIKVEFNQPVNRGDAERSFSLSQFGQPAAPVPGSFEWLSDSSFRFSPAAPLTLASSYKAVVAPGVRAVGAAAASASEFGWGFATVEQPRIVSTVPAQGATTVPNYGLRIQFATPMDRKSVEEGIVIEPKPNNDAPFMSWDPSDLTLYVGAQLSHSTAYRVRLSSDARDRGGLPLDQPLDLSFTTGPMQPTARMFRSGQAGSFNAYLDQMVMVSSWNVDRLDFKLYRIDQETFIERQGYGGPRQALPDSALMRSWSVELMAPPLNKAVVSEVRLDSNASKLPEGFYVIGLDAPGIPRPPNGMPHIGDELPFLVSSVNLTTKWTNQDVLIWAVDMKTGEPLSGWRFDVMDNKGKGAGRGSTGDDGIATIDVKTAGDSYQGYFVAAKKDNRVAFSGTNWSEGISPYNYGSAMTSSFHMPALVSNMFTDRPIYRPNETVHIKGVVRSDDDTNYTAPAGLPMELAIYDQQGRELDKQQVSLSEFGSFDSSLSLAANAAPGLYNIMLRDPAKATNEPFYGRYGPNVSNLSFRVAEFVKPEFEVTVTTDKEAYVNGEQINATVSAQLYFGSPLSNAEVHWKVTGGRYEYRSEAFSGFQTGEYRVRFGCQVNSVVDFEPQRQFRQEGIGRTDLDGKLQFILPADASGDTYSQAFTIEARVTDANQQQVSEFINVPVHKGRFYIGLKPQEYAPRAGRASKVNVVSIDPLSNKSTPNVALEVSVFERKWRTVRERGADGQQVYKSVNEDTLVQSFGAATGADGLGSFDLTLPYTGQFYISVKSRDNLGNSIQSSLVLWASGTEFASWHIPNDDRFTIVPDKDEYKPGETARILIAAPFEGAITALITQERGKVLAYETRRIAGNSEVLELPIVAGHVPNFYLSVVLFKAPTAANPMPQVKFGLVQLNVSNDQKKLNISLEPSAKRLHPRDSVTYNVRTTDNNGRGMPAEVSLALVDKAVLALQDDFARPAIEAFWSKRPLGVITASSFVFSIDRANELAKSLYPGGKGGGGSLFDEQRTYFPNTAFWEPSLRTDANGRGSVEVKLPDSTTTWRLTARGVSLDTRTGEARTEIVTARDIVVRPDLPRFLVAGDEAKIGALVNNTTEQALEIAMSMEAAGVQVSGEPRQQVSVAAGRSAMAYWLVKAQVDTTEASFSFNADGGSASDSIGVKIPVHSYFTAETVATSGDLTAKASEAIQVPSYVLPDAGGLTVNLTPSLVSSLQTGYDYLKSYPYESAEATVSRFVVALALERAVKDLKLTDVETLTGNSRPLVQRSLQRLYDTQQKEGGWGWWKAETADPLMTAYVLAGLGEAKRAGYSVDGGVELRAATYLKGEINKPRDVARQSYDLRAFMLYALARDGRGDLSMTYALAEQRANLSNTAKAWVAQTLKLAGSTDSDPRLTSLLSDLQSEAVASASGTHWQEGNYDRRVFGSSLTTTTEVVRALTVVQPDNPLLDGAVRWLMAERKDRRWQSSYNTAAALLALTDFMLSRKDVQQTFDYSVALNGESKLEGKADKGQILQEDSLVISMQELVKDEINDLLIARKPAGDSRLYYTAQLRYFTPAQDIEALSRGAGVSHDYFRADGDESTPVREVQLGDLVKVKVTLVAPADLNYLTLEDFLPAGLEPLDTTLKITSLDIRTRLAEEARKTYQVNKRYSPFSQAEVHDNRIALFARFVTRGVYEYSYYARATTAGSFRVPPAHAYEQYFPEVFGRSDGGLFVVTDF